MMPTTPNLHWKMARAEFERLRRDAKCLRNHSGRTDTRQYLSINGLLSAADEALHRALEAACE